MKQALLITLALLAITIVLQFLPKNQPTQPTQPAVSSVGMPWQITLHENGTAEVFGLTLERSTLVDAERIFGIVPEVAIVGKRDEPGSLEAYFDGVSFSGLNARVVVTIDLSPGELQSMQQRSPKVDYMESTTRRAQLAAADSDLAHRLPLRAVTLLPAGRLDQASIVQRFGEPAERIKTADAIDHFLYPSVGVDVAINASGKAVIQYVAPAQFHRLREPLQSTSMPQAK